MRKAAITLFLESSFVEKILTVRKFSSKIRRYRAENPRFGEIYGHD